MNFTSRMDFPGNTGLRYDCLRATSYLDCRTELGLGSEYNRRHQRS